MTVRRISIHLQRSFEKKTSEAKTPDVFFILVS
jgi:hypothetical protein